MRLSGKRYFSLCGGSFRSVILYKDAGIHAVAARADERESVLGKEPVSGIRSAERALPLRVQFDCQTSGPRGGSGAGLVTEGGRIVPAPGEFRGGGRISAPEIINQMELLYDQLETGAFLAESRSRSNVIGRRVLVIESGKQYPAYAEDIEDQGHLVIRTDDGLVSHLGFGEVSLKLN